MTHTSEICSIICRHRSRFFVMHTFGYKNSVVYRPLHCESRPEIVRYMVWNSILADVKILKVHTCKRVSSYFKTFKIYLWTWKFIPANMKVHTCKHQVHTFKPGVHIKIINFCIGPNKIQNFFTISGDEKSPAVRWAGVKMCDLWFFFDLIQVHNTLNPLLTIGSYSCNLLGWNVFNRRSLL